MAEGNGTASHQQQRLIRVSEGQRALVLAFMSEHPQLAAKAIELQHGVTVADRRRLWQELSDALNLEGPAQKSVDDWQAWWRRQVHEARRDAAAIKEAQTGTGGGRLPGFRGRVLQLTGLARFGGVFGSLEYQQQADVPAPAMEVELEATEAAAAGDSDTATQAPPSYLESGPAAPVPQPPVRPRRQQRPRRTDTLLRVSSQCDQSLELTEKLLDEVRGIRRSALHLTSLARRMVAALERAAAAQERAAAAQERAVAEGPLRERDA
ncbi:uncharacterized protein LOC142814702 [Rhipicephalus microplus]|uniref:uncharacterized protein LOC142814702 n=1 Tax=Rhipicephalus microplus TaxID=6941 RepID=UPI003F6D06B2